MTTHVEVTTTVVLTDSIGRHRGTVINTAQADAPDERYVMTFARGAIQSTEHQIAAALKAQFGEHPEAEAGRARAALDPVQRYASQVATLRQSLGMFDANEARTPAGFPFEQGDRVTLLEGEHEGRSGRVYETQHAKDEVSTMTIELEPPGRPDDPSEPIVLTRVRFDEVERGA